MPFFFFFWRIRDTFESYELDHLTGNLFLLAIYIQKDLAVLGPRWPLYCQNIKPSLFQVLTYIVRMS